MIGREADLEALRDEFALAAAGGPRAVVIGGEAGIGKSRLLSEFLTGLEGVATVLLGRCVDLGSDGAPYAPFATALRRLIDERGLPAVLEAAGPSAGVLSALLPELADEQAVPQRTGRERLYELVTRLFENISDDAPLVLAIEDVHWADSSTLELLRFVLRMVERGRILVVLTYRSDEVVRGHPLRSFLPELDRTRRVTRWELSRLGREQVVALVEQLIGGGGPDGPDPESIQRVNDLSEGVPFFVEELVGIDGLRTGDDLPETFRELLLARYERLSDPAQRLLRLIAAGGSCVRHELLEAVYDGPADELDAAAREAIAANLLAADSVEYSFRHALVREAIHADLLPGERSRFHARFAEALEAEPHRSAVQLSSHWLAAHDLPRAFAASVEAMDEAKSAYAYATAAAMGDRMLELWDSVPAPEELSGRDRVAVMALTASALRNAGDNDRALALVDEALRHGADLPPSRRARLLRDKAQYLANLNRPGSDGLLRDALALVPAGSLPVGDALRTHLLTELAARQMIAGEFEPAIETASRAVAEADGAPAAMRSVAHNILGSSLIECGCIAEALAELDTAARLAGDEVAPLLRYAVNASDALSALGRYDEAVRVAATGLERARERGVERTAGAWLAANQAEAMAALGRYDRAAELLGSVTCLDPRAELCVRLQQVRVLLWSGDAPGADDLIRRNRAAFRTLAPIELQSRLGVARAVGEVAIGVGDHRRAWEETSGVGSPPFLTMPGYDLPVIAIAARALAELASEGDAASSGIDVAAEAGRLDGLLATREEWPTARVWAPLARAELATARLAVEPRDSVPASDLADEAAVAWAHAIAAANEPIAPVHLRPYALLRAARVAFATGRRGEAEQFVLDARDSAEAHGIGLLTAAADALIRKRGSRAPVPAGGGVALTEREEEVLALIEQGLSNKQIGERLFISAKTASVHVSSILRKVGASSRTEAVYRAGRVL